MCSGRSWDEIDETLTVHRYVLFCEYWKKHPPLNLLVAAYIGYEYSEPKEAEDFFEALMNSNINKNGLS